VPRSYVQRARAAKTQETRDRILRVARTHLPGADELRMDDLASVARVSVQTLYSHFGSKGGLLATLFEQEMAEAGTHTEFEHVWRTGDGEAALRAMLEATFAFWRRAWPLIAFALRVRRSDRELGERIDVFDQRRLARLVEICRRLRTQHRLVSALSPAGAAQLAFSLSTPYVYEAFDGPASPIVEAIVGAVVTTRARVRARAAEPSRAADRSSAGGRRRGSR